MTRISGPPGKLPLPSPVNRYLRVEAYYQYAARVAGTTVQASLDATLRNSTVCNAIAGNATAYGIMANRYKSSLNSYIDSHFSAALNLLCYRCKAKTYLYRNGDLCTNINSGWNTYTTYSASVTYNSDHIYLNCDSANFSNIWSKAKFNFSGFSGVGIKYNKGAIYSSSSGYLSCSTTGDTINESLKLTFSNGTYESKLGVTSGTYYICIQTFSSQTKIYNIYLY